MTQLQKQFPYKKEEDKRFFSFKKLSFKKITELLFNILAEYAPKNRSEINSLIDMHNYNIIFYMLESGYELTSQEKIKVEQNLGKSLEDDRYTYRDYVLLDSFIKLGFSLPEKSKAHFFSNLLTKSDNSVVSYYEPHKLDFFMNSNEDISLKNKMTLKKELTHLPEQLELIQNSEDKTLKYLTHELKSYIHDNIEKIFLNSFNELIQKITHVKSSGYPHIQLLNLLEEKNKDLLLSTVPLSQFLEATKTLINFDSFYAKSVAQECNNIIHSWYKEDINKLIKNSVTTTDRIKQKTQKLLKEEVYSIKMNSLPKEVETILGNINELYNNLHNKDDYDIKNLFENKIPEILKKYLVIDQSNRKTLRNVDNKNAEELMIDSLNNIKQYFENKYMQDNENALSSLSATNRYTKKFNT